MKFKSTLAIAISCKTEYIPYIGQSIKVIDKIWQGEFGSHKLRLIVDKEHFNDALNWINQRDNKIHVRFLNCQDYQQAQTAFLDGFSQKLNFKNNRHKKVIDSIIEKLGEQLNELQNPQSDVGKAESKWKNEKTKINQIQTLANQHQVDIQVTETELQRAVNRINEAKNRFSDELNEQQQEMIMQDFPSIELSKLEQMVTLERDDLKILQDKTKHLQKRMADLEYSLSKKTILAKNKDTGALSEVGAELEDVDSFLKQLEVLNKKALPQKLERFVSYLNQPSDQGVTQLLTQVENEVSVIEERIDELNQTLQGVDFQHNRFIQLVHKNHSPVPARSVKSAKRST
ncbi:MAG: hypothetical protein ACJAS9_000908 [Polaribacter sp.]